MLALLLVSVDMRVADLNQWAREALVEERRVQELGSAWKPAEPAAWNTQAGTKVGTTLQPVERALQLRTPATLENVSKAMQYLRLPGHRDGLRVKLLQRWLYSLPSEKAPKSKKKGAAGRLRCYGRMVVQAAALVFRRGALLRTALGLTDDVGVEEVLSSRDEIAQLKARLAEAEKSRAAEQKRAERAAADKCKAQDAHRKLKERGQQQRKAAKATAAKGRTEALAKQLARSNERIKAAKARMAADARAAADKRWQGKWRSSRSASPPHASARARRRARPRSRPATSSAPRRRRVRSRTCRTRSRRSRRATRNRRTTRSRTARSRSLAARATRAAASRRCPTTFACSYGRSSRGASRRAQSTPTSRTPSARSRQSRRRCRATARSIKCVAS